MPHTDTSSRCKAAYRLLYEATLEENAAKCRLHHEKKLAERALLSITDTRAADLGSFHKAEASAQWWKRVVATVARIAEEQQGRDRTGRRDK